MKIFNTHLEFNREKLFHDIDKRIAENKTGYICVCDSSVVTRLQREEYYREVINGAYTNTCDGSVICTLANKIYGPGLESINGPEIFAKYSCIPYKQVIMGNTVEIVAKVREKVNRIIDSDSHIDHLQVPFCKVEDFDYESIAKEINNKGYDIIWVSLGNPKQEIFMRNIEHLLSKGVMFGIGAALNFWVGDLALPRFHIGSMKFIWLTRIFQDPIRQIKMNWPILKTLPFMYLEEKKRSKQN